MQVSLKRGFLLIATTGQKQSKPTLSTVAKATDGVLRARPPAKEIVAKMQPDLLTPKAMGARIGNAVRLAHMSVHGASVPKATLFED